MIYIITYRDYSQCDLLYALERKEPISDEEKIRLVAAHKAAFKEWQKSGAQADWRKLWAELLCRDFGFSPHELEELEGGIGVDWVSTSRKKR